MTTIMNAETIRLLLSVGLFAMFVLALLSLRHRQLTWIQFALWGLFSLFVPALGPFLTILAQPGRKIQPRSEIVRARRRR